MISFSCWHCGAAIRAKDSSAGLKGKCKKCGKDVIVPTPVVEDAESAISELEASDWGVENDEQEPYGRMPNPSRARKPRDSKTRSSKRFGRLLTLAFLFASAAGLVVSLGVAFDRDEYGKLVRQLALEIDLAGRRVRSPEGHKLIELFGELRDIHMDAGRVWDVKLSIPVLRDEAEKRQKFLSYAPGNNVEPYLEFKNQVTPSGIPMKDFARKTTGLDDIAERYALPITTTKWEFKIIPMDSVERIFAVAREKQAEIGRVH